MIGCRIVSLGWCLFGFFFGSCLVRICWTTCQDWHHLLLLQSWMKYLVVRYEGLLPNRQDWACFHLVIALSWLMRESCFHLNEGLLQFLYFYARPSWEILLVMGQQGCYLFWGIVNMALESFVLLWYEPFFLPVSRLSCWPPCNQHRYFLWYLILLCS